MDKPSAPTVGADPVALLAQVRAWQHRFEAFTFRELASRIADSQLRALRLYREWVRCPMNYARIMEIPLTYIMLNVQQDQSVLDISSPKFLAFYLAKTHRIGLVAADLENYFLEDFEVLKQKFGLASLTTATFSATNIPYAEGTFDSVYATSVFEHIPGDGDIVALKDVHRVLRPQGVFAMTLPAHSQCVEEWIKDASFYWRAHRREDGAVFYQRRYSYAGLQERFQSVGLALSAFVFVAERPLRPAGVSDSGRFLHNSYFTRQVDRWKILGMLDRLKIPFAQYLIEREASRRCHYLTVDPGDPNIRQIALRYVKV